MKRPRITLIAPPALCCLLSLCSLWAGAAAPSTAPSPRDPLRILPARDVQVTSSFWAPKLRICKDKTIPHSWQYVAGSIRAMQKAGGMPVQGELNGTWDEANLYKFMETVAHSLGIFPDPELEKRADDVIALIAKAQRPDGYVHAYVIN